MGLNREDVSGNPILYMALRALVMISDMNVRALDTREAMSGFWPNLSSFSLGIRQRGQGQAPRSRMVANRTLEDYCQFWYGESIMFSYFSG